MKLINIRRASIIPAKNYVEALLVLSRTIYPERNRVFGKRVPNPKINTLRKLITVSITKNEQTIIFMNTITKTISSAVLGTDKMSLYSAENEVAELVANGWTIVHSHVIPMMFQDVYQSNPHSVEARGFEFFFILTKEEEMV